MFSRYSDQASSRKGFALLGLLLLLFAAALIIFEAPFLAVVFGGFGAALVVPAFAFGHSSFAKVERALSYLAAPW